MRDLKTMFLPSAFSREPVSCSPLVKMMRSGAGLAAWAQRLGAAMVAEMRAARAIRRLRMGNLLLDIDGDAMIQG